jgi:hypothetical protein
VNTTARIEAQCRPLNRQVLVSEHSSSNVRSPRAKGRRGGRSSPTRQGRSDQIGQR